MTPEASRPERSGNLRTEHLNVGQVLVAENRGTCGGVKMALETTKQVLDIVAGKEPVYTNGAIVHNRPIMDSLNLVNIDNDWTKVPDGAIILFFAHGVPPSFYKTAREKNLLTIDTTCQLVTSVHHLVRKAEQAGKFVLYIGVEKHPETQGVLGELQSENYTFMKPNTSLDTIVLPTDRQIVVYSQTTLSTGEIKATTEALQDKFPGIEIPRRVGICPATDVRQEAVVAMLKQIDALLVVGSKESHNTEELIKIGEVNKLPSFRIDGPSEIKPSWFGAGIASLGITSGASVPEEYLKAVLERFRKQRTPIIDINTGHKEKPTIFSLPQKDIDALKLRYAA